MYMILIPISIIAFVTGLLLFAIDKELKYLNELGLKKVRLVTVKKFNFLFIYQKRNERIITKFVLVNTLIFYAINLLAITFLALHFALKIEELYIVSCVVFFVNLVILVEMGIRISLNNEQKRIKYEDQKRRKNNKH